MLCLFTVDYVCVMDVGMFEISLRTTNTANTVSALNMLCRCRWQLGSV